MEYIKKYFTNDIIKGIWLINIIFLIMITLFYILDNNSYGLFIKTIPFILLLSFIVDYFFSGRCKIYKIILFKLSCVFWLFISINLYISSNIDDLIFSIFFSLLYVCCFLCSYIIENKNYKE